MQIRRLLSTLPHIPATVFHLVSDEDPERWLLGTLHRAARLKPRAATVLLCNPFGEEAARAHRVLRVLAQQLERAGFDVLRFDYRGTGDSSGDHAEARIATWVDDIARAALELRTLGPRKLIVVGLRLGASLAWTAAARGKIHPHALIAWDPIQDGGAYLQELEHAHQGYMHAETAGAWVDTRARGPHGIARELLGTPMSEGLVEDLRALRIDDPPAAHLTVITTRPRERLATLRPTDRWLALPAADSWDSDAALNAQIVPIDVVQAIVARIEELAP